MNYTAWCRKMFSSMPNDGAWIVPRSGLIFCRQGNRLALVGFAGEFPFFDAASCLHPAQQWEFDQTRKHFGKAGIAVIQGRIENDSQRKNINKAIEKFQRDGWRLGI
jgi:hypothetical protein